MRGFFSVFLLIFILGKKLKSKRRPRKKAAQRLSFTHLEEFILNTEHCLLLWKWKWESCSFLPMPSGRCFPCVWYSLIQITLCVVALSPHWSCSWVGWTLHGSHKAINSTVQQHNNWLFKIRTALWKGMCQIHCAFTYIKHFLWVWCFLFILFMVLFTPDLLVLYPI